MCVVILVVVVVVIIVFVVVVDFFSCLKIDLYYIKLSSELRLKPRLGLITLSRRLSSPDEINSGSWG